MTTALVLAETGDGQRYDVTILAETRGRGHRLHDRGGAVGVPARGMWPSRQRDRGGASQALVQSYKKFSDIATHHEEAGVRMTLGQVLLRADQPSPDRAHQEGRTQEGRHLRLRGSGRRGQGVHQGPAHVQHHRGVQVQLTDDRHPRDTRRGCASRDEGDREDDRTEERSTLLRAGSSTRSSTVRGWVPPNSLAHVWCRCAGHW
ncbi:MAG: hypothetical protein QOJ46_1616 [bacterium]